MFKKLLDANPYKDLNIGIRKIECVNHLFRNLCDKLSVISTITQKKGQRQKNYVKVRNEIKAKVVSIQRCIEDLIAKENAAKDCTTKMKVDNLRCKILNVPDHMFGDHTKCRELGFVCVDNDETLKDTNWVPFLHSFGFHSKIEEIFRSFSGNAKYENEDIEKARDSEISQTIEDVVAGKIDTICKTKNERKKGNLKSSRKRKQICAQNERVKAAPKKKRRLLRSSTESSTRSTSDASSVQSDSLCNEQYFEISDMEIDLTVDMTDDEIHDTMTLSNYVQDSDCELVGETNDPSAWTDKEINDYRKFFDRDPIDINEFLNQIMESSWWLNDDVLDAFRLVAKAHTKCDYIKIP